MFSWEKAAARLWNLLPLPFEKMAVEILEKGVDRRDGVPLNKICDLRDWEDPLWRQTFADMGYVYDPSRAHRKEWEFTQGVYGLRKLRCLSPDATALGLGCGHEPILYFLARRLRKVVATDLYEGEFGDREADPRMLRDPDFFAPFSYPQERLKVKRMDGTRIAFPDQSFDLVFSFSSIEHFGSREDQGRCLAEIRRVLRPGGIALVTTEMILNTWGRHGDYFQREELLDRLIPESGLVLTGGDFDFSTSRETLEGVVQFPREISRLPHLILRRWRTCFTSCSLFLEKLRPKGSTAHKAARGEEVEVELPPLLQARITKEEAPSAVAPGTAFTIQCMIENRGTARWISAAPDGVGLVRLGAHLYGEGGKMIARDYGRADLPGNVAPGDDLLLTITLTAPGNPGSYAIELDMVREGVAWFAACGDSEALKIPLTVAG